MALGQLGPERLYEGGDIDGFLRQRDLGAARKSLQIGEYMSDLAIALVETFKGGGNIVAAIAGGRVSQ